MPFPIVFVKSFTTPYSGTTRMTGTPENSIEDRALPRRFYNFNMIITIPFAYNSTNMLELTDNDGTNTYHMIDRLGNPVLAEQLVMYAGTRRCLNCRYDSATQTVMVLSNICPTNKYILGWLETAENAPETDK